MKTIGVELLPSDQEKLVEIEKNMEQEELNEDEERGGGEKKMDESNENYEAAVTVVNHQHDENDCHQGNLMTELIYLSRSGCCPLPC